MDKFKRLSPKTRMILMILFIIFALLAILVVIRGLYTWYVISGLLSRFYEPDIILSSPDGQHELVIREFSCLGGSGAEFYIREPGQDKWYNSWMMKEVGNAGMDDYCQPFTAGSYYVIWESDQVTVCYHEGLGVENEKDRSTWRGKKVFELE